MRSKKVKEMMEGCIKRLWREGATEEELMELFHLRRESVIELIKG